ncbi:MAG: hypothetical protein DI585_01370 [Pseudomonas fluorescens]|nr:MAG: hypothetical protein DI585_01370 [Pseudomonas fluorescens]
MPNEYLSTHNQFITDATAGNRAIIEKHRLFSRAMLEDIGGKLVISGHATLSPLKGYAAHFNYYSEGRVLLIDERGTVFHAFLMEDDSWEVELPNQTRHNQRSLAELSAVA